jgi:hypothetical protein
MIYRQIVQLVIFLFIFNVLYMCAVRFDVTKNVEKFLNLRETLWDTTTIVRRMCTDQGYASTILQSTESF